MVIFPPKTNYRSKYCLSCNEKRQKETLLTRQMTLQEAKAKSSKYGHPAYKHVYVTSYNRLWNSNLTKLPCQKCKYDKHINLCHIKAVKTFPETATLGEINHPNNNLVLCPNHHWEFDHGLLDIKDIPKRS